MVIYEYKFLNPMLQWSKFRSESTTNTADGNEVYLGTSPVSVVYYHHHLLFIYLFIFLI